MFQGFSQQTIDFLWGIRFNNNREWFLQHKKDYLTFFYNPLKELCTQVQARFLAQHESLQLNSKVSRIYRDARRVKYGGPYKDNLWLSLREPVDDEFPHPVLYFEVRPEGFETGFVYWSEKPALMEHYRKKILREPEKFEKLVQYLKERPDFVLSGAEYKRSKGDVSDLLKPWFNRKEIILAHTYAYNEGCPFFSEELIDRIVEDFNLLLPFFYYFKEIDTDYRTFLMNS